jgi:hypothetical protein
MYIWRKTSIDCDTQNQKCKKKKNASIGEDFICIQPSKIYKYTQAYRKRHDDPGKQRVGELKNKYVYMESRASLLPPIHRLLAHLNETSLGFTIGEITDGSNGLVGVILGQSTSLLNTVTLMNELTGLVKTK